MRGTDALAYDPLDPATRRDPYPVYRRLRDEDPVHRMSGRDVWVLSRFADIFHAVSDSSTFSSAQGLTFDEDEIGKLGLLPTIVMMDRPEHTTYRRLVNRGFTPRRVTTLEPVVRAYVQACVDRIAESGDCDFVAELADPLPSLVVAHYLGVPETDRYQFRGWSNAIVQANAEGSPVLGAAEAVTSLYQYFTGLVDDRRRRPDLGPPEGDMLSDLLQAEVGGRPLDIAQILGFCFVMIAGGNDTTSGLLSGSVELLSRHPEQRQRLLADPGLVPGAVEECLRMVSPVQGLSRTVTQDVVIHGVEVRAGHKVHLLYGSGNRDPREFGEGAASFDVTRRAARMLAFGGGPHHCLGAAAARLQGRVVLEELLARLPHFSVDADAGRYASGAFTRRFEELPLRATT